MRLLLIVALTISLLGCTQTDTTPEKRPEPKTKTPSFDQSKADYLYKFAFECIDKEYPNKLGQVIGDASYLKPPKELHPSFYGCFDWHSAVHGHWTLVTIVERFPEFEKNKEIIAKLKANITDENIKTEIEYFGDDLNKTFERTYGWAWLLKLAETLKDAKNPEIRQLAEVLQPLTDHLSNQLKEFLPKLTYPIRVGEHTNTAFGLSFALDYSAKYDKELETAIIKRANEYYANDKNCPLTWEPSGFDFLSPCLQEAALMNKVLDKSAFENWLDEFLPGFTDDPSKFLKPAEVSDRSDGKLAHLDGLNFSRAWCLYETGNTLGNQKLIDAANLHLGYSYEKIDSGKYAGTHWLASFAAYALVRSAPINQRK
jgi:hypothetical protein